MILIRFLIFAAIAWYGYRLVRHLLAKSAQLPGSTNSSGNSNTSSTSPQPMQACAHCSVHVPVGESTQSHGKVFCSEAHRDSYFHDNPPST